VSSVRSVCCDSQKSGPWISGSGSVGIALIRNIGFLCLLGFILIALFFGGFARGSVSLVLRFSETRIPGFPSRSK
jgi:hypothetical protein